MNKDTLIRLIQKQKEDLIEPKTAVEYYLIQSINVLHRAILFYLKVSTSKSYNRGTKRMGLPKL